MSSSTAWLAHINKSRGVKLGLENVTKVANQLGNVHNKLKCIHVAGTNGKGSVSWKLSKVLSDPRVGARVGMFTSPHISSFRERIRINGEVIAETDCTRVTNLVKDASLACDTSLTYFESLTLMAMVHFEQQNCDITILECGLGGLSDSTNVIQPPLAAVVTSIAMDHQARLGNTLEEIAMQKAGIIKPGTDNVIVSGSCQPLEIFRQVCRDAQVPLHVTPSHNNPTVQNVLLSTEVLKCLSITPTKSHWQQNLAKWLEENPAQIENELVMAKPPCRFQLIDTSKLSRIARSNIGLLNVSDDLLSSYSIALDVAHNPAAFQNLGSEVIQWADRDTTCKVDLIVGFSTGKDVVGCITAFRDSLKDSKLQLSTIRIVKGRNDERAMDPNQVLSSLNAEFGDSISVTISHGVQSALQTCIGQETDGSKHLVIVCGSFFVMDEALLSLDSIPSGVERDELDMNEIGV